jgi:hypothetical protein
MSDIEKFLENFRSFGADPNPGKYEALFDPKDGTVLHPGMESPLHRDQVRVYMQTVLSTIHNFRFEIACWAEQNGVVFIEAKNSGLVGGESLSWGTVYRVILRGSLVLAGRAYGDRIPILARLFPEMKLREIAGISAPVPGLMKKES